MLKRMAAMRSAKARKRLAGPATEPEPSFTRTTGLSLGVRDDMSGVVAWVPLKSLRDAARRLAVILREYQPGRDRSLPICVHPRPSAVYSPPHP